MVTTLVFETHSWSEDNNAGIASGWNHGRLSERGRVLARELGQRRRGDVVAVFTSDLRRATETADIAFEGSPTPVLHDWRLRECDYGELNGSPADDVHGRRGEHLDVRYPGGESWREAVERVGSFLPQVPRRWRGGRVLLIGHVATRWALEHFINGRSLEELLVADFGWKEGWEYRMD